MRFIGFIYYFILWPIILYISFAINPIFGLVILLVVLREYWKLYKLGDLDMLTRMLASDKGWFKAYAEAKKSTDDYLALTKKIRADAEKELKKKGLE
jgi:hypothetical protein